MSDSEKKLPSSDKLKALDKALEQIDKKFGKNSIMDMSKDPEPQKSVPTGSLPLDIALGIGGIPVGRIMEVYGPESSGKTTLCYHLIAEVQKRGGIAAFIDTEHAMDAIYASKLGVDLDSLLVSQPDYGEQALDIAEVLVSSGAVDIIVIDSVAALTPKAELDGEMGDHSVGLQARMMSKACRKLAGPASQNETTIVFTNQIREKVGVMFGCFSYDQDVILADGTTEKIGRIVDEKLEVEVLSVDPVTREVAPAKVVSWFNNGPTDSFLEIGVGDHHMTVTPNHIIITPEGEVAAEELRVGSEVLVQDGDKAVVAKVTKINAKSVEQKDRYDIEVEGNHTYLADGIVVHNSPETQPGGRALKFYASVRLDIRRIETVKDGTEAIGNKVRVKVVKNKVAAPFRQAEFMITFGEGFDQEAALIDFAQEKDIDLIQKSGSFFTFTDGEKRQGANKAKQYLKENPALADAIELKVRQERLGQHIDIAQVVGASADTANKTAAEVTGAVTSNEDDPEK